MRVFKTALFLTVLVFFSSCSCRLRHVGAGSNIPTAGEGSGNLKDVNFAFDSFGIDASAKEVISANAKWLNDNKEVKVSVEGHCDERGTTEYNMALGANRAKAVYDQLVAGGVAAERLSTVSYGEELPLDPAHNETAWAKNRRAHFSEQ
jgi:peptidoglycan-associated lipoprotein